MSILEEGSISAIMPMMGVFNNLVLFDQHVPQNRVQSIVPDLATRWAWNEEGTELTFNLREGVKWHDGKPFTAADVKCTYDLLSGKAKERLRLNYREAWFLNLDEMTTNGDREVTFHLKRPQPAFISLLASGYSPIYPCHVSARDMRTHPVGTDQGGTQPGLLEAGASLSRRHRIYDHPQPLDRDPRLCRRQIRHDLSV
jgi:peptide/nickel transport system substrate-binding protein